MAEEDECVWGSEWDSDYCYTHGTNIPTCKKPEPADEDEEKPLKDNN